MRCLVTGCAGFIGSHLVERLLQQKCEVIGVDNLLTGTKKNMEPFQSNKNFRFFERSVSEPVEVDGPVDWVFHFASPASPKDYTAHPIPTLKAGGLGTYYMLGLSKAKKANFMLASTSEVYGDPKEHPQKESYCGNVNPIGKRSMYDEAKRFAEAITMAYHRQHGISIRIARIFNTYGPRMRMDDGRVIPNFIIQALKGEPITIYGDGRQTRSFGFITDLIDGIMGLMRVDYQLPVNLGNPKEYSIRELAETIKKMTATSSPVMHFPLPEDDPKKRCPDISLARKLFSFDPRISLREGLEKTIPYFRAALQ